MAVIDQDVPVTWNSSDTVGTIPDLGVDASASWAWTTSAQFGDEYPLALITNTPYAIDFDGSDDYVDVGNKPSLTTGITNALTAEAWVKAGALNQGSGHRIAAAQYGGGSNGWIFRTSQSGNGRFWPHVNVGGTWYVIDGPVIPIDEWTHIALTYDGETLLGYINGVLIGQNTNPSGNLVLSGQTTIGASLSEPNNFDGLIDEVRVWNIVRSQAEIQATMKTELKGDEPGLAGYWRCNEGGGTVVKDKTANLNNGTIIGGAGYTTDVPFAATQPTASWQWQDTVLDLRLLAPIQAITGHVQGTVLPVGVPGEIILSGPYSIQPVLWLDVSQTASLHVGDAVDVLVDQSGNGRHARQSNSSRRPTYRPGIANGHPAIRFDGTDDYLDGTLENVFTTVNDSATLFVVGKFTNLAAGNQAFFEASNAYTQVNQSFLLFHETTRMVWRRDGGAQAETPFSDLTTFHTWSGLSTTAARRLYLDHGLVALNSQTGVGFSAVPTVYRVGALMNTTDAQYYLNGDISEVLLFNKALTTIERQSVETYLVDKYQT